MGRQIQQWRSGDGEKLWLSMLVDTMEKFSGPEHRGLPCDPSVMTEVLAHLERAPSAYAPGASCFSLRN